MIDQLKQLRLDLDGLAHLTAELKPIIGHDTVVTGNYSTRYDNNLFSSEAIKACTKSLQLAKAWVNRLLTEFGDWTEVSDIELASVRGEYLKEFPQTDSGARRTEDDSIVYSPMNHIQKVDWLRQAINVASEKVKFIDRDFKLDTREKSTCRTQIWTHLVEARLHLGFELERLKTDHENSRS